MKEEVLKPVQVELTTDEISKIISSLSNYIEWIEGSEELKQLDQNVVNGLKEEYKDLGIKFLTIIENEFKLLKEFRNNLKNEL